MLALLGLAAGALALAALVLPFWSFVRVYRLTTEVAALRTRLETLERQLRVPHDAPEPVGAEAEIAAAPQGPPALSDRAVAGAVFRSPESAPPVAADEPDDLETRVGGRWLLYAGVAILLIGVSFFLKYAFDNAWIAPAGRVALGMLSGVALVAVGWRVARTLSAFGLALTGTGIVIVYLAIYAGLGLYGLFAPWTASSLMLLTTLGGTWLADRSAAQSLAVIAITGGFLTPFMVSGTTHDAVLLFSYDLLLAAGVLLLARRHRWLALPVVAYLLTVITLAVWAGTSYRADRWLMFLTFLTAFCLVFVAMLRAAGQVPGSAALLTSLLLWTAPLLYHVTTLVITSDHPPAFHVYLILFSAAGILLTSRPHRGWLRLVMLAAAVIPLFGFLELPGGRMDLLANVVTSLAIAGMHVMALLDRSVRQEESLGTPDLLILHAALIGLFGLLSQALTLRHPDWNGGMAAVIAIVSSGLWFYWERRDPVAATNAAGLSFTLVAMALAAQFEGRLVVIGWAFEGAVAAWFGVRSGSLLFRFGGLVLLALAIARLTDGYFDTGSVATLVNERSLATMVVVIVAYTLARAWRHQPGVAERESLIPISLHLVASVLTVMWISAEITSYWDVRPRTTQAALSEELMRSLGWGLYGALLVVAGMWRSIASIRWIGIAVIGVTVIKVFFVDLSQLGGIYRVIGFTVVGVLLVAVSYLYQRSRDADRNRRTQNVPGTPLESGSPGTSTGSET